MRHSGVDGRGRRGATCPRRLGIRSIASSHSGATCDPGRTCIADTVPLGREILLAELDTIGREIGRSRDVLTIPDVLEKLRKPSECGGASPGLTVWRVDNNHGRTSTAVHNFLDIAYNSPPRLPARTSERWESAQDE